MRLFQKKQPVKDYNKIFKETYQFINKTKHDADMELDYTIKQSLLELVVSKYDELIDCINHGANYDLEQFQNYKAHVETQLKEVKDINENI